MTSIRSLALVTFAVASFAVSGPRPARGDHARPPAAPGADRDHSGERRLPPRHRARPRLAPAWRYPRPRFGGHRRNWVNGAQASTTDAIGQIQADAGLASSPIGQSSLGLLDDALLQQDLMLAALDQNAKVKVLIKPNILAMNSQIAAIEVLKDHLIVPGIFDDGLSKKESKAIGQFYQSAHIFESTLQLYGITTNPLVGLFDGAEGGKKKDILARLQLQETREPDGQTQEGRSHHAGNREGPLQRLRGALHEAHPGVHDPPSDSASREAVEEEAGCSPELQLRGGGRIGPGLATCRVRRVRGAADPSGDRPGLHIRERCGPGRVSHRRCPRSPPGPRSRTSSSRTAPR